MLALVNVVDLSCLLMTEEVKAHSKQELSTIKINEESKDEAEDKRTQIMLGVCGLLPLKWTELIAEVPVEVFELPEDHLEKEASPTNMLRLLRTQLWDCIVEAQNNYEPRVSPKAVVKGICSEAYLYKMMQDHAKIVWLLTPVAEYTLQMRVLLQRSLKRLDQILNIDINEYTESRIIGQVLKAIQMVDTRVMGAIAQKTHLKIDQKVDSKTVNIDVDVKVSSDEIVLTPEEINQRLLEMQTRLRQMNAFLPMEQTEVGRKYEMSQQISDPNLIQVFQDIPEPMGK